MVTSITVRDEPTFQPTKPVLRIYPVETEASGVRMYVTRLLGTALFYGGNVRTVE